jgi:hypothetical protein
MSESVQREQGQIPQPKIGEDQSSPDEQTQEWKEDLQRKREELNLADHGATLEQRQKYVSKLFWLLCVWLFIVVGVLLLQGWRGGSFWLSDAVLAALLGTTTVNVVGLFYVVAKFLYPSRVERESPQDEAS